MEKPTKASETLMGSKFSLSDIKFDINDPLIIIFIFSFALIFTFVLFSLFYIIQRQKARRSVLLVGLCDAGKTLIWSRLLHGRKVETHTSIKENCGVYQTNKGALKIVDIPGHERLRMKFLDQYKSSARALIFVVDALSFQKDLRDVAEFLFNILIDNVISRNNPAVLILAHKQDQAMAKGSALLQVNLERELNLLRDTKYKQLESLSDKANSQAYLGKQGKDFTFAQLTMQIDFAETSAVSEDPEDLQPVKKWLAAVA